jgi:hypothetical protein
MHVQKHTEWSSKYGINGKQNRNALLLSQVFQAQVLQGVESIDPEELPSLLAQATALFMALSVP